MAATEISPSDLRLLLAELLRSDSDFDAFCLDHFPDIHRRFGSGMDRLQKENLLLLHAQARADIVVALRRSYPEAAVWRGRADRKQPRTARRILYLSAGVSSVVLLTLAAAFMAPRLRPQKPESRSEKRSAPAACGALSLDDVFVVREAPSPVERQLLLDIRLRHGDGGMAPVNITRAVLECEESAAERSPYLPSASYELLISGPRNEAALAQKLAPGEVDRVLLRLGFTPKAAASQYTATLNLLYNGGCVAQSAPFVLSWDAARWPARVPPAQARQPARP